MTTTQLIEKVRSLAQIGIVNAKEDAAILQEAADRLHELRAKADPKWYQWLIMDDGLFLVSIKDGESDWTEHKDDADAKKNLDLIAKQLYDLARLQNEPLSAEDMNAFVLRSNEIMEIMTR